MKFLKKGVAPLFLFCLVILCIIPGTTVPLYPADAGTDGKKGLQIEIYGGISYLNPGDLNLLPRADALTQEFLYEGFDNFLYNYRYITSWAKTS